MNVDQVKLHEAEARQEEIEPTIECPQCRTTWVDSQAWECPDCHKHYCPVCKPEVITVCWTCFDHEDAFDEVAEIEREAKDASS